VLFEMLVGKVPREATGLPASLSPAITKVLDATIQRCTRSDPANRFQSAAELKADLASVEKKVERELLKSPNAARLMVDNSSPQVAAAAKKIRRKLKRKLMVKKLRSLAVLLLLLGALGFGAWKMNLIPNEILAKLGLPVIEKAPVPMSAELEKLHTTFGEQLELKVDAPRNKAITALTGKYDVALTGLAKTAKLGGDVKLVEEIAAESSRFASDGTVPGEFSRNGGLANLQRVLKTEMGKIDTNTKENRSDLIDKYDRALEQLIGTLEGEGRTEDAERVQQERERIAEGV
ncbi:MAG: hypothetical protein ACI9MB_005316, partial [Verrucomicrobiales bacterium]